ncbi:ABC transporter permease [Paenibacillus cymbidii]|uniref:ABC transporter permease n=1 Tax=Paenibacillus cymbidii TaxID=1639034 RepID=UPI001081B5FA|nr:ABC transporter permease [Paenibacillus cymbidii]
MNSYWTVVRFTFMNRIKAKAFLVTSLIFAVVISLGLNLPAIIDALSSGKATKIGMIEDKAGIAKTLQETLAADEKPNLEIVLFPPAGGTAEQEEQALAAKLKAGDIKGYLLLVDNPAVGFPNGVYKAEKVFGSGKQNKLEEALRQIKSQLLSQNAGLTKEQLAKMFSPVAVQTLQLSAAGTEETGGKSEAERNAAFALVYALLFVLFMIITMYGNLIATEITAEKSSRVMEIIITSVSPLKQMFGKITGMFLLGMLQVVFFVVIGLINLAATKDKLDSIGLDLGSIPVSLIVYFLVFFILGFFLYATLLAGIGSLVSRTEELGQAIMPVTMLSLVSFYISIYGLSNPTSSFITGASFVPFFTPMLMFLRIGMVGVPVWQIALGFVSLGVGIFVFGWLGAKIYRIGVLMYGKRPSFKEVFKAMRAM